ncbi:hypothetical protein LXL04_023548 [Taraxacum kok-saghyz]
MPSSSMLSNFSPNSTRICKKRNYAGDVEVAVSTESTVNKPIVDANTQPYVQQPIEPTEESLHPTLALFKYSRIPLEMAVMVKALHWGSGSKTIV